ncbi:MAG: hypothetical protein KY476_08590 [Planctomycetes bacterium]|nr:hypothetical protein [Planctomycetota bacterium]
MVFGSPRNCNGREATEKKREQRQQRAQRQQPQERKHREHPEIPRVLERRRFCPSVSWTARGPDLR